MIRSVPAVLAGASSRSGRVVRRKAARGAKLLTTADSVLDIELSCGFRSPEVGEHAARVNQIGPCIGLYHGSEDGRQMKDQTIYSIAKKELAPQPVLIVRRRVNRSEIAATIGACLGDIFQYAQEHGIAIAGYPFTRYLDAGPGLITMEPGMPVAGFDKGTDPHSEIVWDKVAAATLPGGPAAVTLHSGSYDTLAEAYAAIEKWMEAGGFAAAGAPWESYLTDPAELPDDKDWKTEVFWPLAG